MDPENVTGKINRNLLELLLRQFCHLIFAPPRNFDILIKHFPNDHKRYYSSHLLVSILHQVAPIDVYLTIHEVLKNNYLKIFRTINIGFWLTLYEHNAPGIEFGLQL